MLVTCQRRFFIPAITGTRDTYAREYCQRRFTFPAFRYEYIWTLSAPFPFLELQTFSISCGVDFKVHASDPSPFIACGREFHLSRFAHLILQLCHLGFRILCRLRLSCPQYLLQGRVTYQEVHASDSSALLLGLPTTLQISSSLPSVSYAGESFTYQGLRI